MHWLTAIFGFGSVYSLAGLIYVSRRGAERDSLVFFGVGCVMFAILAVANELRRRSRASKDEQARLAGTRHSSPSGNSVASETERMP